MTVVERERRLGLSGAARPKPILVRAAAHEAGDGLRDKLPRAWYGGDSTLQGYLTRVESFLVSSKLHNMIQYLRYLMV
jgi:hypothetical protein